MKSILTLCGVFLIIAGIVIFASHGFTYTKHQPVAQIGDVKVSAETDEIVYFPPYLGGISLIAGIVLIIIDRKNK